MIGAYVLGIGVMLVSMLVGWRFKSKFKKYAKIPNGSGLTGREIAIKMLEENEIFDVKVVSVSGQLTDHYNPTNKTVNLSPDVYSGMSIASAAVASHECGHAVQHAKAYSFLAVRSAMVPALSISSKFMPFVIIGGILLINTFPTLLLIGIILFAITTLFAFVTLPVEFDASKRALAWLESSSVTVSKEHVQAKDALNWAAMTYVVAALGSLATLLYYVSIFLGRR
ncbi:MAG: Zn-dependent membrane protease YugP [Sphingobacteriales bacterium]|jgi:Zn-dependent membrane protease YugP